MLHAKSLELCPTLCDPWTVAHQAPPPMGFSRQEYWSGLLCPPPGALPYPGIKPMSLTSSLLAGSFFTTRATLAAPTGTSYASDKLQFSFTSAGQGQATEK